MHMMLNSKLLEESMPWIPHLREDPLVSFRFVYFLFVIF
jgi:hypothetical protein